MKKNIGVIYGGVSVEHDVSIITGLQVIENLDKNKYNIFPFYIDKSGYWFTGEKLKNTVIYKSWEKNKKKCRSFYPSFNIKDKKNLIAKMDAVVIAAHGNFGEDGKLQGFLDFIGIPYSSSGVVGSAAGMDKIVMKKIFLGINLPVLPYIWFDKSDWLSSKKDIINKVHYTLDYPVFVKPANLGSSIGITIAKNESELVNSIEIAINYDNRIIVEKGVTDAVEVNCSVIRNNNKILISELEEPVRWESFLSFTDKYIRANSKSKQGLNGMSRKMPADINSELKNDIEDFSEKIYKTMDCKGIVRIDFLLNKEKTKVYVNEINTVPGSLSFYLWEPKGISFSNLLDILINESIKHKETNKNNIVRYDSELLNKMGAGSKR